MIKLDISETELWNRFENGDVKAFSIIYEHHVDDMFRYGMKICGDKEVALDSIHDVFVKIFSTHKVHSQIRNPKAYLLKALRGKVNALCGKATNLQKENKTDITNENKDFEIQVNTDFCYKTGNFSLITPNLSFFCCYFATRNI